MVNKIIILVFASLMAFALNGVEACPGCKYTSQTNNKNIENVQKGFSYSVIFMLLFPMGLIAGVGRYSYHTIRKVEAERDDVLKRKSKSVSSKA
ncbi:MAG: hypothetical protein SGI98_08740 [Verrucomicrobiota bacterium]|nr:hypothetical protein [Verrucomicrobiota bacterium]